jgi:hypothetical protein
LGIVGLSGTSGAAFSRAALAPTERGAGSVTNAFYPALCAGNRLEAATSGLLSPAAPSYAGRAV